MSGPIAEVVPAYLNLGLTHPGERIWNEGPHAPGNSIVRLRRVRIRDVAGATINSVGIGTSFGIDFEYEVSKGGMILFPSIPINNEWGTQVIWSTDTRTEQHGKRVRRAAIARPYGFRAT